MAKKEVKSKKEVVVKKELKSRKSSKKVSVPKEEPQFNPYEHLDAAIDSMDKKFSLSAMAVAEGEDRISTGLLTLDIALAGGLLPGGWYTSFGGEQSCKTTLATTITGSVVTDAQFKGIGALFDYEGSFQADYAENIFRYNNSGKKISVDNVFGVKGPSGWEITPRVRYYAPSVGESFFNWLAKLEKTLPDLVNEDGKFYYIFPNTKANQKALKGHYDKAYFSKHNVFRLDAPNGMPQAVVLVDSYPAMVPQQTDDKEEGDRSLGSQARMFSEGLKRVKGAMRSKRIVVLGINQLRDVPMAMYGPSEQEPCGKALRFFCLRNDMILFTNKGMLTAEAAYTDGIDSMVSIKGREDVNEFGYFGKHVTSTAVLSNGTFISGKREHRVAALRDGSCRPDWVEMKDLRVGSYVPVKLGGEVWADENVAFDFEYQQVRAQGAYVPEGKMCKFPKRMTPELAELLGMLTADGYLVRGGVSIANRKPKRLNRFTHLVKHVFDLDIKVGSKGAGAHCKPLVDFLYYLGVYGKKSRDKNVSWAVLQSKRECVVAYLTGLFNCDSFTTVRQPMFMFASASGEVAHKVQLILNNMGIASKLKRKYNGATKSPRPQNGAYPNLCDVNSVSVSGDNLRKLLDEIPFTKNRKKLEHNLETFAQEWSTRHDLIPCTNTFRSPLTRVMEWLRVTTRKKRIAFSDVTEEIVEEYMDYCAGITSTNKRVAYEESMDKLLRLKKYTETRNLIWVEVEQITHSSEPVAVYDANMPETSTTVANGVVSHNSDVRFRMSSVSVPHAKGPKEDEDSIVVDGGTDTYRYIKCKVHKNKLGGPQGTEISLRICVENAKGESNGFCRVWDCYQYLKVTGQIGGNRKKIKFLTGPFEGNSVSFLQFKLLVDGKDSEIKEACASLGMRKPVKIYNWCRTQVRKGDGYKLFIEKRKEVTAKAASSPDDDDE